MDALNSFIVLLLVILNGKTNTRNLNIVFGLGGFLNYQVLIVRSEYACFTKNAYRSNDQAYGTYYREGPNHISELKISSKSIEQHRSQYRNSKIASLSTAQ
jgi:hypothetical protein